LLPAPVPLVVSAPTAAGLLAAPGPAGCEAVGSPLVGAVAAAVADARLGDVAVEAAAAVPALRWDDGEAAWPAPTTVAAAAAQAGHVAAAPAPAALGTPPGGVAAAPLAWLCPAAAAAWPACTWRHGSSSAPTCWGVSCTRDTPVAAGRCSPAAPVAAAAAELPPAAPAPTPAAAAAPSGEPAGLPACAWPWPCVPCCGEYENPTPPDPGLARAGPPAACPEPPPAALEGLAAAPAPPRRFTMTAPAGVAMLSPGAETSSS
jgi:hypothetical protein